MSERLNYQQQSPELFKKFVEFNLKVKDSAIEESILDLVFIRASQINGCAFCLDMHAKQATILAAASRLLKPGGRLVYATCSLLVAENEAIGEAFGAAHPGFEKLDAAAVLDGLGVANAAGLTSAGSLRLWPHLHATDGFFAMIWRKV